MLQIDGRASTPLQITTYLHCAKCLRELPVGTSPMDYQRVQVGLTEYGIQVWCTRHDLNVAHVTLENDSTHI